jgi:hypothetical protein
MGTRAWNGGENPARDDGPIIPERLRPLQRPHPV